MLKIGSTCNKEIDYGKSTPTQFALKNTEVMQKILWTIWILWNVHTGKRKTTRKEP